MKKIISHVEKHWLISLVGMLVLVGSFTGIITTTYKKIFKNSDVVIVLVAQSNSYDVEEFPKSMVKTFKIEYKDVGDKKLELGLPVTVEFFDSTKFPKDSLIINTICLNQGNAPAKNIKIDIDYSESNAIKNIDVYNAERIRHLGFSNRNTNHQELLIPELLPGEKQQFRFVARVKKFPKVKAWSEDSGPINYIYFQEATITPIFK